MHRNVERLIGQLATDPGMQSRFTKRPLQWIREQGLELTEAEIEALAATPPEALRDFSNRLDPRIRKASIEGPQGPTDGPDHHGR